jgi:hypothetical protein
MPDAFDARLDLLETMMRRLTGMIVTQQETNQWKRVALERMEGSTQRQDALNERRTAAIERLGMTQARIETLLARVIRGDAAPCAPRRPLGWRTLCRLGAWLPWPREAGRSHRSAPLAGPGGVDEPRCSDSVPGVCQQVERAV